MKIRNGFVSNSSSSSFVAIAKKIDKFDDITDEMISSKYQYLTIGKSLSDGDDVIFINDDNKKFFRIFKKYKTFNGKEEEFNFYKIFQICYLEYGDGYTDNDLKKYENGCEILDITKDDHSNSDIEDLMKTYLTKEERQALLRENKLRRILK